MESNILENSLIHLLDAVNRLSEPAPDNNTIKYALVHLWRGLTLLLKKRLFDEHWSLIYKNTDHTKTADSSGGFTPIDFADIEDRLAACCRISIVEYNEIIQKIRKSGVRFAVMSFTGKNLPPNVVRIWIIWAPLIAFNATLPV